MVHDNYILFSLLTCFTAVRWKHEQSLSSPVVDSVAWASAKVKDGVTLEVEDGGFGWHEAKDSAEVGRVGTPGHVVDGTLLGCLDTRQL